MKPIDDKKRVAKIVYKILDTSVLVGIVAILGAFTFLAMYGSKHSYIDFIEMFK